MNGESNTICELIDEKARVQPDAIFLLSPENGGQLTFRELQQQTSHLANYLRKLGLRRGDKVAFLMDNGLFPVQLFLGAMYGGFVLVPLNARAGVSTLTYTLDHSDATAVFVEEQYRRLLEDVMTGVARKVQVVSADVDGLASAKEAGPSPEPLSVPDPEDPALLMYTSGSTGQPKGAVHSHRTVLTHGKNSIAAHKLTAADRSLLVLPLYHINAECVTLIPALLSGGSVVVPHHFSVSQFWDWLDDQRCTWSAVVPTIISQLLDWQDPRADRRQATFQRIRFLRSSSAPLSPSLHREFLNKFPILLLQAMGCSEGGNIFSNPLPPGENKIGSAGLPWGFETRIINRDGSNVVAGEPGEVLLRGRALMQGYYKDKAGTAVVLDSEGWFHTGDLAYQDPDGYFFVIGRSKELIIKSGVNIAPKQIDEVLESHPSVLEAAAVGVPDRYLGEDLVAFVVLRSGKNGDDRALMAFCESRLGAFKTPSRIHFVTDLPKGPSGKIQRLRLQGEAVRPVTGTGSGNGSSGSQQSLPSISSSTPTPIEQTIAATWAEILKRPEVGLQTNFFSLGGHSLMAIQCLSRLREKLPAALSLSDFFEHATVAQQAALIRQRLNPGNDHSVEAIVAWEEELLKQLDSPTAQEIIPQRDRNQCCALSPAQQRLWFFEKLVPDVPLYNESEAVRLRGNLNLKAMEQAFNAVIARHEILRSTIRAGDDLPTAIVQENWHLPLKQIDLSELLPAQQQIEVERLLIEEPRRPFQLEAEPGIRATLLRLAPQDHVLILMMHHLVCDWSSEGIIWRELSAGYRAWLHGQPLVLPPLAIQHGDYAAWQKQRLETNGFKSDVTYWKEHLRGAPPLLELPADRPRPSVNSYRGARKRFGIGPSLVQALRDCSQKEKVSLFTFFTAALDVLLNRYTGQEDILLGIPLADRDRPEVQPIIGFLLHTHVLRTRVSGDISFRNLLANVQKGVLDLYSHRAPPFDLIVSQIAPQRNLSYSPLFQVMINWRDRDQQLSSIGMEGLAVESLLAETRTAKFDLTLMLTDDLEEIWLEMEYNTDLFDADRIARMVGHLKTLLAGIVANPEQQISGLPLLTANERAQQLVEWNRTAADYPKDRCLHELFELQAEQNPDGIAVVFENESLTYSKLNQRAGRLAQYLKKLEVGPDSLVGICLERSMEMVVGLLGILKAGGAYVPLDPAYPKDRLAFMLEDAQPAVLLTQQRLLSFLPEHSAQLVQLDADWPAIARLDNPMGRCPTTAKNLAYVLYTSGSTGKPKGVQIPHQAVVNFLISMRQKPGLTHKDALLAITTLSFDIAGLELWLPLISGARTVIAPREATLDGGTLARLLEEGGITIMQATPSTWQMLLAAEWNGRAGFKMLCGGEPWSGELARQLQATGGELWNMYGPTETTIWSAAARIHEGQPVWIGKPIANTQFYVLDAGLQPAALGVPGELYIGGDGLASGYLRRPELTAEKFIPSPFNPDLSGRIYKTGDLVRQHGDGRIEFLSRIDNQVKIRGFRIELGEIEAQLNQNAAVKGAVVVAREDAPGDKRLVAYLQPKNDQPLQLAEIRSRLKAALPEYMLPTSFVIVERFPLTPSGKIDRKALPKPELNLAAAGFIPPKTPVEIALAGIWSDLLGLREVGLDDNFFGIGGHSLFAMRLVSNINRVLKTDLPVRILFQSPTVRELAKHIPCQATNEKGPVRVSGHEPEFMELKPGQTAQKLVFLIDEGSLGLFKLAHSLETNLPIFASVSPLSEKILMASAEKRTDALPSLEELAATHVELIRRHIPDSPVVLAGHCFGGELAFEVARQLQRIGQTVPTVLMLDTWMAKPTTGWRNSKIWLQAHLRKLCKKGPAYFWQKSRRRINLEKDALASHLKLITNGDFSVHVPWAIISRIYRHASTGYRPSGILPSRGVLFLSRDDWKSAAYRQFDESLGAKRWFGHGVEVVDVPGDHVTALEERHLLELAQSYTRILEKICPEPHLRATLAC